MSSAIQSLSQWVQDTVAANGLWAVFGLMVLESACIPVPSEVTMIYAGYLVSQGEMNVRMTGSIREKNTTGVPCRSNQRWAVSMWRRAWPVRTQATSTPYLPTPQAIQEPTRFANDPTSTAAQKFISPCDTR